jgi:uncharacterized protein (DUF2267 family)
VAQPSATATRPAGTARRRPDQLVGLVRDAAGLEREQDAARACEAVLGELAAAVSWWESQNVADWLPARFRAHMHRMSFVPSTARFSPRAFIARSAEHEGVDPETGALHVKAVLGTLELFLPAVFIERLREELTRLWMALETTPRAGP